MSACLRSCHPVIGPRPVRLIDPGPRVTIHPKLVDDRDSRGRAARGDLRASVVCMLLLGAGCGGQSLSGDAGTRAPVSDASAPVFDASPQESLAVPLPIRGAEAAGRLSRSIPELIGAVASSEALLAP